MICNSLQKVLVCYYHTGLFIFMGMYQRIEYMRANGFLDNHTTENGIVLPMSQLVYIYKLTFNFTGQFYIGQTNSIKDRMYAHLEKIIKIVEGQPCAAQPFHYSTARAIKEKFDEESKDKRKKVKLERFTRDALSVYLIALVGDKDAANVVESHYIKRHSHDSLCCNSKK